MANIKTHTAFAENPRQWTGTGHHHIIVEQDLDIGRLHRKIGDALCKPRVKFWGLREEHEKATCPLCLQIANRLGIQLSDTILSTQANPPTVASEPLTVNDDTIEAVQSKIAQWQQDADHPQSAHQIDLWTLQLNWMQAQAADGRTGDLTREWSLAPIATDDNTQEPLDRTGWLFNQLATERARAEKAEAERDNLADLAAKLTLWKRDKEAQLAALEAAAQPFVKVWAKWYSRPVVDPNEDTFQQWFEREAKRMNWSDFRMALEALAKALHPDAD